MTRPLLIFGAGDIAELADFYFQQIGRVVSAFAVDAAFIDGDTRFGRPLMTLEEARIRFPPEEHDGFVALSYSRMNKLRASKAEEMERAGYSLSSYLSPRATILTDSIGKNCLILEDNTIQPFSRIGDNVTLWSGNHVGHHSTIEDNVFVSSHVVISGGVKVGRNSFLGVNSTIVDHVTIAPYTLLGAGCIVQQDTEAEGVYGPVATIEKRKIPSTRLRKF